MTTMPFDGFQAPSEMGGGGPRPSLAQLQGRLLHIFPTDIAEGVTSTLKPEPHTRMTCDVTFLDGPPIGQVLNKLGAVTAVLTPPIEAGTVVSDFWINQGWFVNRLKRNFGHAGWPGLLGVLGTQPSKNGGNPMWCLLDPTIQQAEQAKAWFQQVYVTGANRYVPAPVAQLGAPTAQPAYAAAPPAPASPWAPGVAPAQVPAAAPVAPVTIVPPWVTQQG